MREMVKSEFDEVEVELVMEAYGVGRVRALTILREKCKTGDAKRNVERKAKTRRSGRDANSLEDMLSAEDVLGL